MSRQPPHKFNVYSELYPASSVAIIGSGIVTVTMGEFIFGVAFVLTGIAVGLGSQVARAVHDRKSADRNKDLYYDI